ncbi:MAG: hypothetical protein P0Y65_08000 [Candidatus Devosia phytovorans]|uniref:Uncharacterized protein n=1 Tax=Candidatus Devosia phytovorans TaxID=3121372 RepID=A0AAJ5VWS5_9HYPH|nr:hypothetical protein [Devosia sp.]WEK06179.1 MAG: hypothetical protein P0Y65_08000 [Devosia sp.]
MNKTIWIIAALVVVQPAFGWELSSSDTKKTWSYSAYQADKSGGVELQFYCDNDFPEDIQMLVFTDQDARPGDSDFPSVSVKVVADNTSMTGLSGYYDEVDGERTLVVDTQEEVLLRDFITAASTAERPLQVEFDGLSHRFAVDGIADVLGDFVDGCDR